MKLTIENLLGIRRAEVEIDGIVEVVGANASGKTSIATVVQALTTHDANPLGIPAAQSKTVYPHDGDAEGYAELNGVEWRPGKGGITVDGGSAPLSRPEAVGLIDYTARRGEKERMESLQSALLPKTDTIVEAIGESLKKILPSRDLKGVLDVIRERGFDAAEGIYAERGREAKRQWQEVTGRNYGVKVAADWRPDGWLANMDSATPQEAEEGVTGAREQLSALHQVQSVSEAEAQAAEEAKDKIPEAQKAVGDLEAMMGESQADLDGLPLNQAAKAVKEAETELARQRQVSKGIPTITCPHCHGAVAVSEGGDLVKANVQIIEAHINAAKGRVEIVEKALAKNIKTHGDLQKKAQKLQEKNRECRDMLDKAKTNLAVLKKQSEKAGLSVDTEDRRSALLQAEQAVDDAKRIEDMVKAEVRASELNQTVSRYIEIARALGSQGVRAKMMEKGLRKLNAGLAVISDKTGWPLVTIADRGAVSWNDRPVALCSESERWRSQASIQLTLAAMTKSGVVVLDRADLLDNPNREGLVNAVQHVSQKTGIAVLLCSTGTKAEKSPWTQITVVGGKTE